MITAAQCRSARALIDWSQSDLAREAGVSLSTIRDFEGSKRTPMPNNLKAIQDALDRGGVIFIAENGEGAGTRLRKSPRG